MTKPGNIAEEKLLIEEYRQTKELTLLGDLYAPYMHLVYGVCLKYLKNREQAQDAVMAIFEELVIKLPKFEIDNFKSWLYVLSKNHCLMELRKHKRQLTTPMDNTELSNMENEQFLHHNDGVLVQEENLEKLSFCIEKLKNEQKQCVELFYLEKKSYQEIVTVTSYELKKVKSHIQNGKRNLKQCMEEGENQ